MARPSTVPIEEVAQYIVFDDPTGVELAQKFGKSVRWAQGVKCGTVNEKIQAAIMALRTGQLEAIRRSGLSHGQAILDKHIAVGLGKKTGDTEVGRKCREFLLAHIFGDVAKGVGGGGIADTPFSQLSKEGQQKALGRGESQEAPQDTPQKAPEPQLHLRSPDGPSGALEAPERPVNTDEKRIG